jgi:hypothetical protein
MEIGFAEIPYMILSYLIIRLRVVSSLPFYNNNLYITAPHPWDSFIA